MGSFGRIYHCPSRRGPIGLFEAVSGGSLESTSRAQENWRLHGGHEALVLMPPLVGSEVFIFDVFSSFQNIFSQPFFSVFFGLLRMF